jgi:hypothetical protein
MPRSDTKSFADAADDARDMAGHALANHDWNRDVKVWHDEALYADIFAFWKLRDDLTREERAQLEHARLFLLGNWPHESRSLRYLRKGYATASTEFPSKRGSAVQWVRVSAILQKGSVILGIVCILSLVSVIWKNVPLLNPFLAVLLLVATPFFYGMGSRMLSRERRITKERDRGGWPGNARVVHPTA